MDYRKLEGKGSEGETIERRWWTLKSADEAALSVGSVLSVLRDHQVARLTQYVSSARLYGNLSLMGLAGINFSRLSSVQSALKDRISYNATGSAIDTVVSKIGKNRPRPFFLTNGGDHEEQRKAKKLNKFCDGVFYENDVDSKSVRAFLDGAVFGDGIIHVFARNQRVAWERVLPHELVVDEMEAFYGEPRQLHRVKNVDRLVLADRHPKHRKAIMEANAATVEDSGAQQRVADLVTVVESWHLPSGPEAEDGKHLISIPGTALTALEPWTRQEFPFARFQWAPRLYGFWAQGLCEQVQALQLELNKLMWVMQRSFHLGGSFKILLENGSKVVKEHLNNEIGTIINYTGTAPAYITPPMVQPELFQQVESIKAKIFEQAGISQLSASSVKPAGLNSGKALREYNDIESDRFTTIGKAYERLHLQLAKLSIAVAKEIAEEEGSYKVSVPSKRATVEVDWKEIDLEESQYVMQCFPISALPQDPAGRLQTVQEYAQAGWITPRQAKRLSAFPDIEQDETLSNAAEEWLCKVLDEIVDEGEFRPPEPFDDLALARELALEYYERGKCQGLPEDRLELLRRFLSQIDALETAAAPPAMPASPGVPQAAPMPAPMSDLIPNVPAPGVPA